MEDDVEKGQQTTKPSITKQRQTLKVWNKSIFDAVKSQNFSNGYHECQE